MFSVLLYRVQMAVSTIPEGKAGAIALLLLCCYAVVALPIGFQSGFLQGHRCDDHIIPKVLFTALWTPAITEELLFRVLLFPHPSESANLGIQLLWGILSLILFILYHPLNALTFYPAGLRTFFHPVFLTLAALLGLICTLSYAQSGSLWPPVFIHWVIVVLWLLVFGGYQRVNLHLSQE